jgi:hypothetical protein
MPSDPAQTATPADTNFSTGPGRAAGAVVMIAAPASANAAISGSNSNRSGIPRQATLRKSYKAGGDRIGQGVSRRHYHLDTGHATVRIDVHMDADQVLPWEIASTVCRWDCAAWSIGSAFRAALSLSILSIRRGPTALERQTTNGVYTPIMRLR